MRAARCILAACALAFCLAALGREEACGAGFAKAERADAGPYTLYFRAVPPPAVGRHFAVDLAVCEGRRAARPDMVTVDARMPAHGHGMGYRPSIVATGAGRFRAEGLMFHMPGDWELLLAVHRAGRVERIAHPLTLR